jgi:protein TonB
MLFVRNDNGYQLTDCFWAAAGVATTVVPVLDIFLNPLMHFTALHLVAAGPMLAAGAAPAINAAAPMAKSLRAMSSFDGFEPRRDKSRLVGLVVVVALHVAVVALLLTYQPAREMLGLPKTVMVEFITPPAPPAPEPPKEQPKPREVEVVHKPVPVPKQVIATTSPTPSPMVVEQAPEPPKPQPPVEATPPSPPAPPAPAPAQPKTVTGVEWVRQPELAYPAISRRLNEQGVVVLRALVNTSGKVEKTELIKSSGYARLDQAARSAMMDALIKPYTENGQPIPIWVKVPLSFNLSN